MMKSLSVCLLLLICAVVSSTEGAVLPRPELVKPSSISFLTLTSKQSTVSVKIQNSNGKTVQVEFFSSDGHIVQTKGIVSSTFALVSVSGLIPGMSYTVRAFVVEGTTQGPALETSATTPGDVPSGPVRDLTARATSSRTVTLTWQPPEEQYINSAEGVTSYLVELRTFVRSRCEGVVDTKTITSPNRRRASFNNLEPNTQYCVVVFPENVEGRARELHALRGQYTFTTEQEAPSNSPTFILVQPQFSHLSLNWAEPTKSNGDLTQYIIQYRQEGTRTWTSSTHSAVSKTKIFINSEFTPGTNYELRIAARNAIGRSPFSSPVQFTMRPPIADISMCRLDKKSATFVWTEVPRSSLGADLEQLKFTLSSGEETLEHTVDKTTSGSVFTGLKDRGEYSLQVELVWSEGERLFFSTDTKDLGNLQTEPNCFPSKPRGLVAPAKSIGAKSFSLSWSAPSTTNGPVVKYIITVESRDSELPYSMTFEGKPTSLTVTNLEEAVQYSVNVKAVNKFGEGPQTTKRVTTANAAPSGSAQNITVVRTSTTAVQARWEIPQYRDINSVGGITGYKVVIGKRCKDTLESFETIELRLTFDGLEPGRTYCVRVFPINQAGTASDDTISDSAVAVKLPDVLPPPKPVGMTIASTHAVLIWEKVESTDELNPVTGYLITMSEASGVIRLPSSAVYFNVTGLAPGKAYSVEVAAENAIGAGRTLQFSFNTTVLPETSEQPQNVPEGPAQNIKIKNIGFTAIEVTWEDPKEADINSMDGITGYHVVLGNKRCTVEDQSWNVQSSIYSVRFGNLVPGNRYCVRVYPINRDGPAVEAVARDSAVTMKLPELLDAPKVVGTALGERAALLWSGVESKDNGNPVLNYIVYRSDREQAVTLPSTAREHNLVNLAKGKTHVVRVAAENKLGIGQIATFTFRT